MMSRLKAYGVRRHQNSPSAPPFTFLSCLRVATLPTLFYFLGFLSEPHRLEADHRLRRQGACPSSFVSLFRSFERGYKDTFCSCSTNLEADSTNCAKLRSLRAETCSTTISTHCSTQSAFSIRFLASNWTRILSIGSYEAVTAEKSQMA